mmetsp:Transcript_48814/g.97730  ORF Transcript_48814/g.97730 Transcript_48814/m.97730 type:complete len:254 (-) Transcript_48814:1051-1812(-)
MKKERKFRYWLFSTTKESSNSKKTHSIFLGHSSFLNCRKSFYDLWGNNSKGFGKGSLSRSEPLFSHPNPCFNSIGRASRERDYKREKSECKYRIETLKICDSETFYLLKKNILEFQENFKKLKIWRFLKKENPIFLWKYILFKKYREKNFSLRSGSKFGGDFLVYKRNGLLDYHTHSLGVLFLLIFSLIEKKCFKCYPNFHMEWEDIQNRTRLIQQVSKFFICFTFGKVIKKICCFCKKTGAFSEILLERFSP